MWYSKRPAEGRFAYWRIFLLRQTLLSTFMDANGCIEAEPLAKTAEAIKGNVEEATFTVISDATPLQERALKLLGLYPVR